MPRHHQHAAHVRRVHPQVGDQRLGEALDRELGRAVSGVRHGRAQAGPEAVDAADIDDAAHRAGHQHRHERPGAEIHAEPVDVEGALPVGPPTGDEAAATGRAGVVEQQVDVVAAMVGTHCIAEGQHRGLVADIGHAGAHPRAGGGGGQAQGACLGHGGGRHIAQCKVHTLGAELQRQRPADAGAPTGQHRQLSGFDLHAHSCGWGGQPRRQRPRRLLPR